MCVCVWCVHACVIVYVCVHAHNMCTFLCLCARMWCGCRGNWVEVGGGGGMLPL